MLFTSVSKLPIIEEQQASGEIGKIFADVKREMGIPVVPNSVKSLAVSPAALKIYWDFASSFYRNLTLPQSLVSMILFSIAERNHCKYCSAANEMTCRLLGVDEQTLRDLARDLGNVTPERLREIILFALKINDGPQSLVAEDYERVRAQGVSNAELMEIMLVAATARFNDTLADAMKIDVDKLVAEALGH
jgi:alkylhydroperoxidase family enzyme